MSFERPAPVVRTGSNLLEFRILGPLEVDDGGGRVQLPAAAKPRALLAVLLLHVNETVSGDRLIDQLWDGRPPASARKVLQTYVSQLRRVLGGGVLLTHPMGYELRVEASQLDSSVFARLVAEAGSLDEPKDAAKWLRKTLALWRGSALADFADQPFAQAAIGRLEEQRLRVLEDLFDWDLALGRHAGLVAELQTLVARNPLRERLRADLMLALYRSGRQVEALNAYRAGRRALIDELGIEPTARLRDLEQAILRQDPALEVQAEAAGTAASPHDAEVLARVSTSFVGRDRELIAVQALLDRGDVRLLTLTGPGGAGKTRLALEVTARLAPNFRDGIAFVDLASTRDPELVPGAIARVLGLRPTGARGSALVQLMEFLRARQILLVIDNFEQILDGAPALAALGASAPKVKIMVTSRAPLRLPEEHLFAVAALALPTPEMTLDDVARTDAVDLFVRRARMARADFTLTDGNAAAVARLCRRLDGLPLALELAAARVSLLSPQAILVRVTDSLGLLKTRAADTAERHRTLRAAIDWSYQLLAPEEQECFAGVCVFVGGFVIDRAEPVVGGRDVVDAVESLLQGSLLREGGSTDGEPRFEMLETVREYARERLGNSGHETETRARHADVYLSLAERAEPALRGPDQARWIGILDAERDNLRAAMAWAVDSGQVDVGLRMGAALWRFWQVRGHVFEGRSLLGRLLDTGAGSPVARAAAQLTMARCAFWQGDYRALRLFSQDSMSEHRRLRDDVSLGFALMIFGAATATHGDPQGGQSMVHDALAIARRIGDNWLEMCSLGHLGMILIAQRDLTTARDVLEEGLRAARQLQDERCVGWILIGLGREALRSGDAERSGERFDQALTLERRLGDVWGVATALQGLATIALENGDPAAAGVSLTESLTTAAAVHDRPGIAAALELIARAAALRADPRAAVLLYGCASGVQQTVNHPRRTPEVDDHDLTAMRATLGESQFDDLWERGRAMPLDEAVALALDRSATSTHR